MIHIIWSYIVTQEFIGVWRHDKKHAVDWIMGPSNIINDCEILEQNRNMHFVNMYIYETCETRFLRMGKTCIVLDICYKMLTDCSFIAYLDLVFNDVRDLWNKRSYFQLLNQKWNRKWRQTLHKKCMKSFFQNVWKNSNLKFSSFIFVTCQWVPLFMSDADCLLPVEDI